MSANQWNRRLFGAGIVTHRGRLGSTLLEPGANTRDIHLSAAVTYVCHGRRALGQLDNLGRKIGIPFIRSTGINIGRIGAESTILIEDDLSGAFLCHIGHISTVHQWNTRIGWPSQCLVAHITHFLTWDFVNRRMR
jgi:hypothetical protein